MARQPPLQGIQDEIDRLTRELATLQQKQHRKNFLMLIYVIAIVCLEMPVLSAIVFRPHLDNFWNGALVLGGLTGFFMLCFLPLWGVYHHFRGAFSPRIARTWDERYQLQQQQQKIDQEREGELRRQADARVAAERVTLEAQARTKAEEERRVEMQILDTTRQEHSKLMALRGNESEDVLLASLSHLYQSIQNKPPIYFPQDFTDLLNIITTSIRALQVQKIKKTILSLGMQYSRLQLVEIAEKCHIDDEVLILEVVQDMIAHAQIRAEYFTSTKSIAFNQQANIQDRDKFAAELERAFAAWGTERKKE